MLSKQHIQSLAEAGLAGTNLFVTEVKVSADNHISVRIDGDEGVTIKDCVELSRAIEGALDRNREDFSLDVSSHGATNPLVIPRQYKRHVGRELEIKLADGTRAEGRLAEAGDDRIAVEYSVRENKPVGKGKITVEKRREIVYGDIREARIKLKY